MKSFPFSPRHKYHSPFKRIIYAIFALALILQGIAPAFAQGPGYLPPNEEATPQVETWQGDDSILAELEHQPEDPPLKLPEQANTLAELAPTGLVQLTAETNKETGLETAVVTLAGAAVTFPGSQIMVIIDEGAVAADIILQVGRTQSVSNPVAEASQAVTEEVYFQLNATHVQDGLPVVQFAKPVHLVLDLANVQETSVPSQEDVETQTETKSPSGWTVALQDLSNATAWHYPTFVTHNEAGILSTSTDWLPPVVMGGPVSSPDMLGPDPNDPAPWRYRWNIPSASTFSGASTYQYPIELPPGRGLTPNIDFSYSSRGVDSHIISGLQGQDPLGMGWSMNSTEISRNFTEVWQDGNGLRLHHGDKFSLVINGESHVLYWASTNGNTINYYALNAPPTSCPADLQPICRRY